MSELDNQLTALANAIREIAAPEGTGTMSLDDMATLLSVAEWRNDALKSLIDRSVTSITIPSGVSNIGEYVFRGCYSLTSVKIPASVRSIYAAAFVECENLTDIYCGFAEGAVSGAPWGAPYTAIIHYGVV